MPRVSIIIPCYNDGQYLPEAVTSARAQTYPNTEIIIVDDHSTDPLTREVLAVCRDEGLMVMQTREGKKGPSAARNIGIAAASGEYILPLDADDRIAPTYVEKATAILDARPEVGICYCKATLFGLKRGPWKLPPYSWEEMLTGNVIFVTALFRKVDWEQVGGYDESLVLGLEDYAFWLRMIALGREVVRIEEELFNYRIKPKSHTALLAAGEQSMRAADGVFRACESIFRDNVHILFFAIQRMQRERDKQTRLFLWKLMRLFFHLEWAARQLVKKLMGRA